MPSNLPRSAPIAGSSKGKSKGKLQMRAPNQAPVRPIKGNVKGAKRRHVDDAGAEADEESSMDEDEDEAEYEDEEADTDEEIERAQEQGKSKKTAKRKRRATSPTTFGAALQGLLGPPPTSSSQAVINDEEEETTKKVSKQPAKTSKQTGKQAPNTILSLAPHVRRSAQSSVLNAKAARLALEARKKREDRAHVEDVIGGWGPPGRLPKTEAGEEKMADDDDLDENAREWLSSGGAQGYEKRLRKVAQRGVVKLFNAIRAAQNTENVDLEKVTKAAGGKGNDNLLGSKEKAVQAHSKSSFLDAIRSSKA